jgi:hypothetical protein
MRHTLLSIMLFTSSAIIAQEELPTGRIEVIKDFEVRLTETRKIRIVPQPIALDTTHRRYEYKLMAPSPKIEYLSPEIKPLAIQPEVKPTYYPLVAKLGFGSPNSWLGAFSYDHVQTDALHWGVDLGYLSANNKKIPLQKFSTAHGRINAGYLLNDLVRLDAHVAGRFETVNFYGVEDIPLNHDALERNFKRYDFGFVLSRLVSEKSSFNYSGILNVTADKDDLGIRESGLQIGGEVGSAFGKSRYPVGVKVMADLSKMKHNIEKTLHNVLVEPYFQFHTGDLRLHLGGLALLKKEANEILPVIGADYHLFSDLLILQAGWKGSVHKNNFQSLSTINPYIHTRLDSINNEIDRRIYAGIRGAAGSFAYELTGAFTKFERKAFFLQHEEEEEQFAPVYDDGHYLSIEGAVQYEVLKHVDLRLQLFQRFYTLDNEHKPWHIPSFGLDGMITYSGGGDIYHVSIIAHGENGLPYRTLGGTEDRLDPLIDLSLHADYFVTESIGAFVQINNILGNNRERWYTYPSFGFNAKAGVIYRMPQ